MIGPKQITTLERLLADMQRLRSFTQWYEEINEADIPEAGHWLDRDEVLDLIKSHLREENT